MPEEPNSPNTTRQVVNKMHQGRLRPVGGKQFTLSTSGDVQALMLESWINTTEFDVDNIFHNVNVFIQNLANPGAGKIIKWKHTAPNSGEGILVPEQQILKLEGYAREDEYMEIEAQADNCDVSIVIEG